MKHNRVFLTIIVLIAFTLSACTLSASEAPTPTPSGGVAPENQLEAILNQANTQTAEAEALGPEAGGGALETSVAGATATAEVDSGELATATPTPQPTQPAVDLTVPNEYTLREGEFPYCIARRFNISANELMAANNLSINQNFYPPGFTLTIPKNAGPFDGNSSLAAHPTNYTVQSGDTFYSVACQYGDVWPEEIAAANNTTVNAELNAGEVIKIP